MIGRVENALIFGRLLVADEKDFLMPAEKLSQSLLSTIKRPASGTLRIRDLQTRGLYAYVGTRSIAFVLRRKIDGVTKPVKLGEFPAMTVTQAREAADRLNGDIGASGSAAVNTATARRVAPTLRVALAEYVAVRQATGKRPMKASTAEDMCERMNKHLGDWMEVRIAEFKTRDIAARHHELTERSGATTANRVMAYLSAVMGWAIYHYAASDDAPLLPSNPVRVLTRNRQWNHEARRQTVVTTDRLPAFWAKVHALPAEAQHYKDQAPIARDLLVTMLFTGMRPEECKRLRVDGVDLNRRVLRLQDTKNHDDFEIPFGAELHEVFRRRVEYAFEVGSEYLFPSSGTNPRRKTGTINLRSYVEKLDAALDGFVSKDLRRTFETIVGNITPAIPLMIQKRLLNHRTRVVDPDVTAGYYVADPEEVRPYVVLIEQKIKAIRFSVWKPCDEQ